MRILIFSLLLLTLSACSTGPSSQLSFAIEEKGFRIIRLEDDPQSEKLQEMLRDLIHTYDLDAIRIRKNLLVLNNGRPFTPSGEPSIYFYAKSRSTDYTADKNRLLSTLTHEEFHAYLSQFPDALENSKTALMQIFPKDSLPTDKKLLADDLDSTYLHLIVCWFEYDSIKKLLGPDEAKRIISSGKVYRWVYDRVLDSNDKIGAVIKSANLINPFKP